MELLVVISHADVPIRPAETIARELAAVYDRAYGSSSTHHIHALPHALMVLLSWDTAGIEWPCWHEDTGGGILATAGRPLMYCPPGGTSEMLSPTALSRFVVGEADGSAGGLGYCGGYFAAAHAAADGRITLINNYLGEVPVYTASNRGVTVWSNKAAAAALLAGLEPKLDPQAAEEFILLSHCLEDRTLWEGVSVEPAATRVVMNETGFERRSYLDLPGAYFAHRAATKDAAAQVVESFAPLAEALRNQTGEVRIHLTGGQDSRAVSAICRHHGLRLTCVTHGTPNEEVASAARLAKYVGMPYKSVDGYVATADRFFEQAVPSLWQSDGLMSLKYLAGRYDLVYVHEEGYLPLEGLGGEYGRAYYYGTDEGFAKVNAGRFDTVFKKAIAGQEPYWPNPEPVQRVRSTIDSLLQSVVSQGLDTAQATTWFYVNQKMRRWATARRNTGWCWVIDPLQMPSWTYRGMSAAPEDQRGDQLIRAVIEAAWPGTTKVPTVPELAYAARYRRIATNRIIRNAMKVYDRFRKPFPEPFQIQTLRRLRRTYVNRIKQAQGELSGVVTADVADRWLNDEPWSYPQTELFWHTLTLAMWCNTFLRGPHEIRPCHAVGSQRTSTEREGSNTRG